jgi:guanosine-3',5'-bis(diphosphate) 3'-pyrophosphohydrolase
MTPSYSLWQRAASFSAWKHRHQVRKDGKTPYAAHPFRVAMAVREVFGCDDPAALAAALLHDTLEDTLTDYDELEEAFGEEVANIVVSLTKNMMLPDEEREDEYDDRLGDADWRARLIKLGDVFDNLSDLPDATPEKRQDMLDKCRRAIDLAEDDVDDHAETARAVLAVGGLMEQKPARRAAQARKKKKLLKPGRGKGGRKSAPLMVTSVPARRGRAAPGSSRVRG